MYHCTAIVYFLSSTPLLFCSHSSPSPHPPFLWFGWMTSHLRFLPSNKAVFPWHCHLSACSQWEKLSIAALFRPARHVLCLEITLILYAAIQIKLIWVDNHQENEKIFEIFHFVCNESRMNESVTFLIELMGNKSTFSQYSNFLRCTFWDVPVCTSIPVDWYYGRGRCGFFFPSTAFQAGTKLKAISLCMCMCMYVCGCVL